MYNGMSFNIFEGNNILDGYYMSFNFRCYVERHITPHGYKFMAMRSWRTQVWVMDPSLFDG
jgi:hypothetical protein